MFQVLAQNSGFDLQETLVKVQAEHSESGQLVGVDLNTGKRTQLFVGGELDSGEVKSGRIKNGNKNVGEE